MRERTPNGEAGPGSPAEATLTPAASRADATGYVEPGAGASRALGSQEDHATGGEPGLAGRIGRYIVLRELGRGGMGVTYVAYDEDLDRKVAIKLVRSDVMDEQARKRLQREARALARLAHPNIVAVHDVGSHGSRAFIAMELVSGKTVNVWLAAQPRAWTEVLSVFRQAGEGLRAAHAAGLVHRDIKPANIIVGDDSRVRVLDFGLAALAAPGDDQAEASRGMEAMMDEQRTDTTSLMGTLAYMAPEHLAGGSAGARSDQFAFCVSLFEALYGLPAFAGSSPRTRLAAMRQQAIADVPDSSSVPDWLHAVVVRGLACEPDARWPSMDALLAELARDPVRPRSRAAWMAAAGLALAAAAVAVSFAVTQRDGAVCTGAQAQIDEVWNQQQRAAIEPAMLATAVPYAAETWQRTALLLDRYAAAWAAAHTDACEDTAVREEQSEELRDQRMQCLARRRRSLRALVGELARIDAASIAQATEAVGHLPLIDSCADAEYLGSRIEPPGDPRVAARVEVLEADLSRAEQLQELGRYEQGRGVAQAAVEAAAGLGYPPVEGRARLLLGMLQLAVGDYQPAEDDLKEAHLLARTSGEHEVALQAATQLVFLLGAHLSRLDDAADWGHHVRAELPWVSSEAQQASSMNTLGVLALLQGKHGEAIDLCRMALALWEQALGPEHPENANALNNLGAIFHARGKHAESAEHHRRALELRERALGPEHPRVARSLSNLGGQLYLLGEYAEAARRYVRALGIFEKELGAEHPLVGDLLPGLALSYVDDGRPAEALPLAERARALLEGHDASPAKLAEARFALARALMATGTDPQRALALARQARDAMQTASGSLSLIDLADIESWLGAHEPRR
jgi:tetratricopeptide (TPR) repeat protein/tRNA A-37 threonylcarbamoyl transferase component Bud32